MHQLSASGLRTHSGTVLEGLELRTGHVVVDVGAGRGWWAARMSNAVGADGIIHAAEVTPGLVDQMKETFAENPEVRPYLCPHDSTGLPANECDLAFLCLVYHHMNQGVDYLCHLHLVVKPGGRMAIVDRFPHTCSPGHERGVVPARLLKDAQAAGWVPPLVPASHQHVLHGSVQARARQAARAPHTLRVRRQSSRSFRSAH